MELVSYDVLNEITQHLHTRYVLRLFTVCKKFYLYGKKSKSESGWWRKRWDLDLKRMFDDRPLNYGYLNHIYFPKKLKKKHTQSDYFKSFYYELQNVIIDLLVHLRCRFFQRKITWKFLIEKIMSSQKWIVTWTGFPWNMFMRIVNKWVDIGFIEFDCKSNYEKTYVVFI